MEKEGSSITKVMTSKTDAMGSDLEHQQTTGVGVVEDINKSVPAGLSGHNTETYRGLTPRHVQLMAIGGSIGTGVFVGIGNFLQIAGPLNLFLGYIVWSIFFTWPCYLCVAEMVAYLPVRGNIFELASRFVDPALGFSMGGKCISFSRDFVSVQEYLAEHMAFMFHALTLALRYNIFASRTFTDCWFSKFNQIPKLRSLPELEKVHKTPE